MPNATPNVNPNARPQQARVASHPTEHGQDIQATAAAPDAVALRNAVFWAQDRARMKAVEQDQLERYMSWNER